MGAILVVIVLPRADHSEPGEGQLPVTDGGQEAWRETGMDKNRAALQEYDGRGEAVTKMEMAIFAGPTIFVTSLKFVVKVKNKIPIISTN